MEDIENLDMIPLLKNNATNSHVVRTTSKSCLHGASRMLVFVTNPTKGIIQAHSVASKKCMLRETESYIKYGAHAQRNQEPSCHVDYTISGYFCEVEW